MVEEIETTGNFWKSLEGVKINKVKILHNKLNDPECTAFLILSNGLTIQLSNANYYPSIEILDKKGLLEWKNALGDVD